MSLRKSLAELSTTLLVMVVILYGSRPVDCQPACYDLIKQYYDCTQLVMIRKSDGYYVPNPNIAGNSLSESFYESQQNLTNPTFVEAMRFVKFIFDVSNRTASKCTKLCKCLKKRAIMSEGYLYPVYFKGEKELNSTIQIHSDFINEANWALKPEETIFGEVYESQPDQERNSMTIRRFCLKNDWTLTRFNSYYNSSIITCTSGASSTVCLR